MKSDHDIPEILYIMGTGRSGTTMLEILLANNPGVFGMGEVMYIFQDGYIRNVTCSCGVPASNCAIWSAVRKRCGWNDEEVARFAHLFRVIGWHTNFPRVLAGLMPRAMMRAHHDANRCLFRAVGEITGARVIVDSSKYAARALLLARAFPGRVRVLCLTRSPAGLISSFQKTGLLDQLPKSLPGVIAYYFYAMICFRIVSWLLGERVLQVRYEEMTGDPGATLARIAEWSGYDLSRTRKLLDNDEMLTVGHIVTGNRLRRQGRVRFRRGMHEITFKDFAPRLASRAMNVFRAMLRF